MLVNKHATLELIDRTKMGGRIRISSGNPDRDKDRVIPRGGRLDRYLANPIVQWGHQTWEPWQTIGRTTEIAVSDGGLDATFELRPAANEADPQNVVLLLWNDNYIRTASIGFQPLAATPNDMGGLDFTEWELLEWSLVPIPANADAMRLAAKSLHPDAVKAFAPIVSKRGRVLSRSNEDLLRGAYDNLGKILSQLSDDDEPDDEPDMVYAKPEAVGMPDEKQIANLHAALQALRSLVIR